MNDRRWTTNEVLSLLNLPLPELMQRAMAVHREHHDPLQVELARERDEGDDAGVAFLSRVALLSLRASVTGIALESL